MSECSGSYPTAFTPFPLELRLITMVRFSRGNLVNCINHVLMCARGRIRLRRLISREAGEKFSRYRHILKCEQYGEERGVRVQRHTGLKQAQTRTAILICNSPRSGPLTAQVQGGITVIPEAESAALLDNVWHKPLLCEWIRDKNTAMSYYWSLPWQLKPSQIQEKFRIKRPACWIHTLKMFDCWGKKYIQYICIKNLHIKKCERHAAVILKWNDTTVAKLLIKLWL